MDISSVHQPFLERIMEVIDKNLDNDKFGVDDHGREIAMSHSQRHRKLKVVTNQSVTAFIRDYRLRTAVELLKAESGNITEMAYRVGFSSRTYFSKCFQELFGFEPSEYRSIMV
jgi:AraC-like DNA-binding protein